MKFRPVILLLAVFLCAFPAIHAAEKKDAKPAAKAGVKTTTGTFLGIDEGDYKHWQMRTDSGEEVSFFILRADASVDKALANPKAFKGRKCRVTWKAGKQNIPEAGGNIDVEEILSVEWLAKK